MFYKLRWYALPVLLAFLLVAGIFIGERVVPPLLAISVALSFLEQKTIDSLRRNKKHLYPFALLVGIYCIYTLLSPNIEASLKVLERQISLLLVPFVFLTTQWQNNRIYVFFRSFLSILVVIGIISFVRLGFFVNENSTWIEYMASTGIGKPIYIQYKFPHIMGVHPTYWSYLLVAANIMVLSFKKTGIFLKKIWIYALWIFLNLNLFFLAARTPIIANLLIHLLFVILYLKSNGSNFPKKVLLFLTLLACVAFMFVRPNLLIEKFKIISTDERVVYWPIAIEKIADNYFLLGEGLGQSNEVVRRHIIAFGEARSSYLGYDLHNQYLRTYLDMGILGIVALMYLVCYPFFYLVKPFREEHLYWLSFTLFFGIIFFTESILYRLKGILFFAIFSSVMIVVFKRNNLANK